ncbi:hypothetical protein FVO59_03805 [Microbacterium esteraromaticum]|uniref:Uncharacterized protein n=1 Tax=Microbacterium esteraromaticum TaxID=57043 RepID=A0A7D8AIG0_9MICO|nr:hypothetical protein FVO59_03805 [Microbacterium esteraromaticum]
MSGVRGQVGVAGCQCAGDQPMLGRRRGEALGLVAGHAPHADQVGSDGAQRGAEVVVGDGGVELGVQSGDQSVVGVTTLGRCEIDVAELVGEGGERHGIPALSGETG